VQHPPRFYVLRPSVEMKVIKVWNSIPIINQKRLYCIPTPSFMSGNAIGKIILHGMAFVTDLNNGTLTKLESCFAYCRVYTGVCSPKCEILRYSEKNSIPSLYHFFNINFFSHLYGKYSNWTLFYRFPDHTL
jgi:hypothetical protein